MSEADRFSYQDDDVQAFLSGDIAVLRFLQDTFGAVTDLAESGKILDLFHQAEISPGINALLLIHSSTCFSEAEYDKFICLTQPLPGQGESATHLKPRLIRYIHLLNRIITRLADFKKITAIGLRQCVVTPFFGASLAADFRFADEGMQFFPAHCRHGLHPSGALPFFLSRFVGPGKATEILCQRDPLTASQALSAGLISGILPAEDFENHCLTALRRYTQLPPDVILSTKLLLNSLTREDLKRYFEAESALLH
jgi:enoyl-CoA hydratase/carnithine racemase